MPPSQPAEKTAASQYRPWQSRAHTNHNRKRVTQLVRLHSNDPLGADTFASGINSLGQIVGNYSNATGNHGFLLSGGQYITLDDPLASQLSDAADCQAA
jgi:probable HAF family extracellular repeat protein